MRRREALVITGLSLAWASVGFLLGASLVNVWPWPLYGNVLTALIIGTVIGVPELMVIRRYFPRAAYLLRLNEEPFPFGALGIAGAVIVFGVH